MSDMITAEGLAVLAARPGLPDDIRDALSDAAAQLADAKAAQAMAFERAASDAREVFSDHKDAKDAIDYMEQLIYAALADPSGVEALAALRAERDRFEAALGRACLVGGTTYLVERAEKAEADRNRLAAANAALEAQVARLVEVYWKLRSYAIHDDNCKVNKPPYKVGSCSCGLSKALKDGEIAALAAVQADARRDGEGGE